MGCLYSKSPTQSHKQGKGEVQTYYFIIKYSLHLVLAGHSKLGWYLGMGLGKHSTQGVMRLHLIHNEALPRKTVG